MKPMKTKLMTIFFSFLLLSCLNMNRDKPVDKNTLLGYDYRLFQDTPAWELAKAVQDNNKNKIIEILSNDSQLINYQEPKLGSTLLMLTVRNQQFKPFKILLEQNADVNIHNTYDGQSAIIEACCYSSNNIKFVELLIQNGANVNDVATRETQQELNKSVLMVASRSGKLAFVELLVENGANVNYYNESGQSPLGESVMQDNFDIAYYLLQNGADYERPILFRTSGRRGPNEIGEPIYLTQLLSENYFEFYTRRYKYKMKVVDFLESKGIDYRSVPIPESVKTRIKERHPRKWKEYLEKY